MFNNLKSKKYLTVILFVVVVFLISEIIGRVLIYESKSYEVSNEFILKNEKIARVLGRVKKVRLSIKSYYHVRGANSWAELKFIVFGEKTKGAVFINLNDRAGLCSIEKSDLVLDDDSVIELIN